ncbi:hypothetical protein LHK19_14045 [Staphylococcus argenteus]|nr:hypothetical protein [Staphylococcus argenteus]
MTWFEEHVEPSVEWERKAEQAVLSDDEVKTITEYREKYNNPYIYMSVQNKNYLVEYVDRHTGDIVLHNLKLKKSYRSRAHQYFFCRPNSSARRTKRHNLRNIFDNKIKKTATCWSK